MKTHWIAIAGILLGCSQVQDSSFMTTEGRAALDEVLAYSVRPGGLPGVVAAITTRDSVIYRGAFGTMDASGQQPMAVDALFQIFSMTKPITSAGIMTLVEEGAVELDAPAEEYLPELRGREVLAAVDTGGATFTTRPASRPITVRDLLRHTSGIGYSFASHELVDLGKVSDVPARAQPILHDPGAKWTYGMGTAFVGWIIEEVSGESLDDFLESRILGPLEMDHTFFKPPHYDSARLVATYRRAGDQLVGSPRPQNFPGTVRGDGGLLSTADDYARFMQMILNGGERRGVRVLSEESVAEMTRDQLEGLVVAEQPGALPTWSRPFPLGAGRDGFGLGFQIKNGREEGRRPPGSLSWAGIQNTHFWIDVENGIGVVLLLQVLPFYDEATIGLLTEFERVLYTDVIR